MVYRGHLKNGVAVLDGEASLPEGIEVTIEPATSGQRKTLAERLKNVIGQATNLPCDAALNHDHYLYGLSKK